MAKKPLSQFTQLLDSIVFEYVPNSQFKHIDCPVDDEYVPATQFKHTLDPGFEYVPAPHFAVQLLLVNPLVDP